MIDAKELTFNAVRPPNVQANPLPDHGPSQGSFIKMISICALGEDESEQGSPSPFVIKYIPTEATVGFAGIGTPPTPFVIDIPVREPYSDDKVPWTYEGGVATDKGKAPAVEIEAIPGIPPTPPKKVTEEDAEAFMFIKASEYKIVEQMAKYPAHISLLALLLSSEPHREALLQVLTTAQVPKGTPPNQIEETVNSIFSNTISFSDDELPSEGSAHSRALHIKLKFTVEEKLITVKGEEDYAIYKETAIPYISVGSDENLPFHSFETIFVTRDYGKVGPTHADRMIGKILMCHNYIPGTSPGVYGQGISHPIEIEEYKHRRGLGFPHYGKVNRGLMVPPLSHFFLGPPHIVGDTLDDPSSDSADTPDTLLTVFAVTEEIPSGVHISLAQ
ncbi:hypothetical protein CRG98_048233 [Punica granatum]|uniref:G-patch domain-containing protein n=1 Tax=Punica granatum TaxID=22663 RepID=A0A2I0HI34_PUNGR|nr:hypothetical protein CRG98_048233 [Punica granatum]